MKPARFLKRLRYQIESHPAVHHPILIWLADDARDRGEFLAMGFQHFALVDAYPGYLEDMLVRAPGSASRQWITRILQAEYGEGPEGQDHAELYREFLDHLGALPGEELEVPLHPLVIEFVACHRRLIREEPFLVGLGALGPGHQWALAAMFDGIVHGLYRAGIDYEEFEFFLQHQEQDVVRCEWLQELLLTVLQTDADMACLEAGALRSLEMHCRFWDAVQARIAAWKRGRLIPVGPPDPAGMTLGALRRL